MLGMLLSVFAFGIDMYIPAFDAIGHALSAAPGDMQLSMAAYFVALALGQLACGPLSDAIGRRLPILAGLALFVGASLMAAASSSVDMLISARLLQGLGASAAAVLPLAMIRDEYSGLIATRLMTISMLSLSASPLLAPAFGGLIVQYTFWQVIFLTLAGIGLVAMLVTLTLLPETLRREDRIRQGIVDALRTYGGLLRDPRFLIPILLAGLAQAMLLDFIAGSPYVIITLHGLTPLAFSGVFALHAVASIGSSQFCARLMHVFGVRRLLGAASMLAFISAGLLAALVAGGVTTLWVFVPLTLLTFCGLGLIMTPAYMTAVEAFDDVAGSAAALGSSVQLSVSSIATVLTAVLANGTAVPLVAMLAVLGGLTVVVWLLFMRLRMPASGPILSSAEGLL